MEQRPFRTFIKRLYLLCRSIILEALGSIFLRTSHKEFMVDRVKKILVIKLERIGDLVLATPVLRELKKRFINSHITLLVNYYTKDLVLEDTNIDEILVYKRKINSPFYWIKFSKILKKLHFDLCIDLTCNNEDLFLPTYLSYFSRAKYTIGLNQFGRGFLFNIRVPYDNKDKPLIELMFDIVKPLGIYINDIRPKINIPEEGRTFVKELLYKLNIKDNDLLIGIHPGGYYPSQRWPEEGFAKVADELINSYKAKVIVISSPKERDIVFKITSLMKNKPQAILTDITLRRLIGLISNLDLLICNNSGPLHIAVALGVPTVSTMGPTMPKRWAPIGENHIIIRKGIDCSPCNLGSCKKHKCMNLITPEDILGAIEVQLNNIIKMRQTKIII